VGTPLNDNGPGLINGVDRPHVEQMLFSSAPWRRSRLVRIASVYLWC
jgi:hypothetical protein